ncbi:autotransporter outer membrane beta-barrel domain-containing protein [Escherichia coli]|uniref:autotransporter outer membrane beta-barrel domain-containing protein n=1 Tax=Escherichia coli TaxID=562 RepID=UPI00117B0192
MAEPMAQRPICRQKSVVKGIWQSIRCDRFRFPTVRTTMNSHHQRDDGKQREFQPYIEANWINNSKVYAVKMNGQTVGREGARNLGEVRTGVEAKVNNNLSLWGNVGVQLGDKGYSDTQGMLGVKYSW